MLPGFIPDVHSLVAVRKVYAFLPETDRAAVYRDDA
jgi:hypothetical protein